MCTLGNPRIVGAIGLLYLMLRSLNMLCDLHIKNEKHKYTDFNTNLTILHKVKKGQNMDRLEELEIYKNKNNSDLLNDKINTKTNKIYDLFIKNLKKGGANNKT